MEYILLMTFVTETGEKSSLSISPVKQALTKDEINTLMDAIIANDIFSTKNGSFVSKSSAQITERKVTKFEVK